MKTHNKISLAALIILFLLSGFAFLKNKDSRTNPQPAAALPVADENGYYTADLQDYETFKKAVMPLIEEMASKKVVSLGEGTHGTHEFNKVRYWITRILVEEKGFNHVAFENDYGDGYLLNEGLQKQDQALEPLMRNYLLRIWQTQEVEELFRWMKAHNARNKKKVQFGGIDHMYMSSEALLLKKIVAPQKNAELNALTQQLLHHSRFQDSIWNRQNDTTFRFDMKQLVKNGSEGYKTADRIEQLLGQLQLPARVKEQSQGFLLDSKLGFNTFYQWDMYQRGSSRDSSMAEMATWITRKKEDKLVIWAHNAHVAKSPIMGGVVGGTGGFIEKKLPGNYFVLGMGTAKGSFAAMEDGIVNHGNHLASYPLEAPLANSWEEKFAQQPQAAFWASTARINPASDTLKHRHIGYMPDSGVNTYDTTNLRDLYDAFFFIKETSAARFFE